MDVVMHLAETVREKKGYLHDRFRSKGTGGREVGGRVERERYLECAECVEEIEPTLWLVLSKGWAAGGNACFVSDIGWLDWIMIHGYGF